MKTTILFVALLVVGQIFAQTVSLCDALGGLGEEAGNGFLNLRGATKESNALSTNYASKTEIADALQTEIVVTLNKTEFIVDYGEFSSESEALAKAEALKSGVMACFPNVHFSDYSFDVLKSRRSNLIQTGDTGFRSYSAHFKIEKWGEKYEVSFRYPAVVESSFMDSGDPGFKDFYFIDVASGNDQFSRDLRELLVKGKSGFVDITGEEIEADHVIFQHFSTPFQVAGFGNCFIETRSMGYSNYIIPVANGVDEATIRALSAEYIQKLLLAFGTDYAFSSSADGLEMGFVHKNQPGIEVARFLVEIVEGTFDLTILVSGHVQE